MSTQTKQRESVDSDIVNAGEVVPSTTRTEKDVETLVNKLKKQPERWGWKITSIVHGHGKVVVQCRTPKGNAAQFVGRLGID